MTLEEALTSLYEAEHGDDHHDEDCDICTVIAAVQEQDMTTKQQPALHEPSCERAVRDLATLERLRASSMLPSFIQAIGSDGRALGVYENIVRDLIALLEPDQ
jgi:hypothetical protein